MVAKEDIIKQITTIIKNVLKMEEDIETDQSMDELEIDSINFIEIVVSIEEQYGFEFDDSMLNHKSFKDIQSIVLYVESRLQSHQGEV